LESSGGAGAEGRAAQIGVDEDAGGIDDGLKAGVGKFTKAFFCGGFDFFAGVVFVSEEKLAVAVDLSLG